jgi:hypothetical protein
MLNDTPHAFRGCGIECIQTGSNLKTHRRNGVHAQALNSFQNFRGSTGRMTSEQYNPFGSCNTHGRTPPRKMFIISDIVLRMMLGIRVLTGLQKGCLDESP